MWQRNGKASVNAVAFRSSSSSINWCVVVALGAVHIMPVRDPVSHVADCSTRAMTPAAGNAVMLTAIQAVQGLPMQSVPVNLAVNFGFVYTYGALQCPMEAIHGRQSLLHNALSGATIGYLGVNAGMLGIFNLEHMLYSNRIPLPLGGALVYGAAAAALGAFSGKRL